MRRRIGRPSLLGTMARTAVVAGTASAVVGHGQAKQQAAVTQQNQVNDMQAQLDAANAQQAAAAQQASVDQAVASALAAQQAAPAPAPAAAPAGDSMAKLQQLAEMKSNGLLTDEEFSAMKAKLLGL